MVKDNVFSMLFRIEEGYKITPDLTTSWDISDDGTVITWHLREGVMFQDDNEVFPKGQGREVTADDVVYSLVLGATLEGTKQPATFVSNFVSAEAIDRYTVKMTLEKPDALLFARARGVSDLAIVPKEAIDKWGENFQFHMVGSGPFKLVEYMPNESVTLVRNDNYWKKPNLDKVVFRVYSDASAALIALEKGEIDFWSTTTSGQDYERMTNDPRYVFLDYECPVPSRMVFNMNDPTMAQEKLRQAIAWAMNGDAINKNVRGALAVTGCQTAGPGVPGYDPDLCEKYYGYHPEEAKALFEELGYTLNKDGLLEKDGKTLELPLENQNTPDMIQTASAITSQLKEFGITVEPATVEFATMVQDIGDGKVSTYLIRGYCGDGGTSNLWGQGGFVSGLGYDDAEFFDLLDKAGATMDLEQRNALLQQAANRMASLYWEAPIGIYTMYTTARPWLHDFEHVWGLSLVTETHNAWIAEH